jgi:hypothetical protein
MALSADSMGGRLVGTPEIERASDWIAARFRALGLAPAGTDGFDERFDLVWPSLGPGNFLTVGEGTPRRVGDGWYPVTVSGSAASEGALVFAGFGIVEPRIGYDSYGGARVAGRIVLVLDREPGVADPASPFDGVVTTEGASAWRKAFAAQERGAVGVLFVRDVHNRPEVDDFGATAAAYWTPAPRRIERFTLGV